MFIIFSKVYRKNFILLFIMNTHLLDKSECPPNYTYARDATRRLFLKKTGLAYTYIVKILVSCIFTVY